jgi:two-component system chemotaxis response regulator CheB
LAERDIVTIGASSGGVEALMKVVGDLPEDLPAVVFVVLHFPESAPSVLPRILDRTFGGGTPRRRRADRERSDLRRTARPPLLVERRRVRLTRGPEENRHRPAVDALFRAAALAYGPRVMGVVLTGAGDDGTAGLLAIKRRGGVVVVQDPEDALFSGMPANALEYVDVDHCLPLGEIAPGALVGNSATHFGPFFVQDRS